MTDSEILERVNSIREATGRGTEFCVGAHVATAGTQTRQVKPGDDVAHGGYLKFRLHELAAQWEAEKRRACK